VERAVAVAGRLVGSAPRSDGAVGLVVSEPLALAPDQETLKTGLCAETFGEVTALGARPSPDESLIAVGGPGKVALLPLAGDRVGTPVWQTTVGFRVASLTWDDGLLWAAGPECAASVDDYDWDQLHGGGFAAIDPGDGRTIAGGPLPLDVAWGTGGVAVAPMGRVLVAAGRTGSIHLLDPLGGSESCCTPALSEGTLGIAHLAVVSGQVVCGFNRGGYRLHVFGQSARPAEAP
jgi:hypothetical protein